jgi:hypothetical protein
MIINPSVCPASDYEDAWRSWKTNWLIDNHIPEDAGVGKNSIQGNPHSHEC